MSRHQNKIKSLLLTLVLLGTFSSAVPTVSADTWDDFAGLFSGDSGGPVVTFTDFKGTLAAPSAAGYAPGLVQATDARTYVKNVVNFFLGFLGLLAVVIVIYGGFMTILAAGDTGKAAKGKQIIMTSATGIIIIMASFAIVNTLLKAPSGSETGGVGGGGPQSIRGVAGVQRYNYLAEQMVTYIKQLADDYDFYFSAKDKLKAISGEINSAAQQVKANCGDYTGYCDDWKGGIGAEIGTASAKINNAITTINNLTADPKSGQKLKENLKNLAASVSGTVASAINAASKEAERIGCQQATQGVGDENYCGDEEGLVVVELFIEGVQPAIQAIDKFDIKSAYSDQISVVEKGVQSIHDVIKGLTAAESGTLAEDDFKKLTDLFKTLKEDSASELSPITVDLQGITLGTLKEIAKYMFDISEILRNVKFVNAVIAADTAEGNAPLIVNFSTVGSSDPSGQTIDNKRIVWDLNGDGIFSGPVAGQLCSETIESAVASCIFEQPGTYRVTVKMLTSDGIDNVTGFPWSQEIAPGIAYVDIKVNPPSTKINLKTSLNGSDVDIIKYSDTGFVEVNRSRLYLSAAEAKAVTFDASATKGADNKSSLQLDPTATVKWNFGFDSPENDITEVPAKGLTKTVSFPGNGNYLVKLEITDKNNNVDRKIFNVIVSDLAPRLSNPPQSSKVGEEVSFDGSGSSSTGASIIFNWSIEKISQTPVANPLQADLTKAHAVSYSVGSDSSKANIIPTRATIPATQLAATKTHEDNEAYLCDLNESHDVLRCTFKQAGQYRVSLYLQDSKDLTKVSEQETAFIDVTSSAPISGFRTERLTEHAPALYILDGSSLSFDPDEKDNQAMEYSWEINPADCVIVGFANEMSKAELISEAISAKSEQISCANLLDYSLASAQPVIKFTRKGTFNISLKTRNYFEPDLTSDSFEQSLVVSNVLDLSWGEMTPTSYLQVPKATATGPDLVPGETNDQPFAPVTFLFKSSQAVSWELDFGDGEVENGDFSQLNSNGEVEVVHNYIKIGKYQAKLTVFDADDIENELSRFISIGNGDNPVAVISIQVNGVAVDPTTITGENGNFENTVIVTRRDLISFDAAKSINTDGGVRNLKYDWNINEGDKRSLTKQTTYQFKNLSENNELFPAKLTVTNVRELTQTAEDSVSFLVVGSAPYARSYTAVAQSSDLTTPVSVKLTALGAQDDDGTIVQYKWWYSPIEDPSARLGLQITTTPNATINIGTRGEEGDKKSYTFGLEMTDSDNLSVATDYQGPEESKFLDIFLPEIEVVNGPNKAPLAKFSVDKTTVNVGEAVNFISSSIDPDQGGGIKNYEWDFGDGQREMGPNKSSVSHIYQKANVDGYKVKLQVTDVVDSVSTSDPVKIYVEAQAAPPVAAFTSEQSSNTKQVKFTNKSTADTAAGASLKTYSWDLDVNTDSNGDGKKDNDLDSTDASPSYSYQDFGVYRAKLIVEDSQGQKSIVTNFVYVKPAVIPITTTSTAAKSTLGADLFAASNAVNPTLLFGSLLGYAILLLKFRKKHKNKFEE